MIALPYLIIFLLIFSFSFRVNNFHMYAIDKVRVFFVPIILIFFLGLRGFISTDWVNYYPFYDVLPTLQSYKNLFNFHLFYSTWEKGFLILCSIIKTFGLNYFEWCLLFVIIDIIVYQHFFKNYCNNNIILCYVFFVLFSGFLIEINLMRNSKSFCLFLISTFYLFEPNKDIKKFVLLNLLGATFHITSIIYIIAGFALLKRKSRLGLLFLFIILNVFFIMKLDIVRIIVTLLVRTALPGRIGNMITNYFFGEKGASVLSIGYLERTFTFIIVFCFERKLEKMDSRLTFFCNSIYLYCLLNLLFAGSHALQQRFPTLFAYSYWIVFPNIYRLINKQLKMCFLSVLLMYGSLKTYSYFSADLFKYDNVLFGITSFDQRFDYFNKNYERVY